MRRIRFRLRTLLLSTAFVAIVCFFLLPFDPSVSFSVAALANHPDGAGQRYPCYHVSVTNEGFFPIWYAGTGGQVDSFAYQGNPTESMDNVHWRYQSGVSWSVLWPGYSALIHLPAHDNYAATRIGLQITDFRGRTADLWSESLDTAETSL